nr:uncharacterized protein LOC117690957 [Crassostrea gigas]
MESCDRQDIDGNGFRTPFRYLRDKFGKKDAENTSPAFHSSTYPELLKIPKKEFDDMETVLAVLDCMKEPIGEVGKVRVYYNLLEADRYGNVRSDGKKFDSESKTAFQIIAQKGDKPIVNHDVVRLLIMRKWEKYARCRFLFKSLLNLITLMTITFSAIVASTTQDPTVYDNSALQIARAVCEMWSLGMIIYKLLYEIQQLYKLRLQYFKYASNWVDTTSCFLILLLPPLRYTHKNEQWFVFSAAYLFWTARMFQYATVFRKSGAYVLVLRRIIKHDILQFTIFFVFILLAFSGCLLLSLRGEGSLEKFSESRYFFIRISEIICFYFVKEINVRFGLFFLLESGFW